MVDKHQELEETLLSGDTPEKMVSVEEVGNKLTELQSLIIRIKKFKRKLSSGFDSFFCC